MPIFALDRPKTRRKPRRTPIPFDQEKIKVQIEERVRIFDIQMDSGNYHGNGGCQIAVPNDGFDCGSCPT